MYKRLSKSLNPFYWKHFAGDIILWLVRWYCRYALSYRDLVEMAAERGLSICASTICRWVQEYALQLAAKIKPYLKMTSPIIHIDETYIKVKGVWHYLYRAIDHQGQTIDWLLSPKRNKKAAKRFFKKLLNQCKIINRIHTDKNPTFKPVFQALKIKDKTLKNCQLKQIKYQNNPIENDHKAVKRKARYRSWYQSFRTAQATLSGMETLRLIQKGQIKYISKKNICAQNVFINKLFGLAV